MQIELLEKLESTPCTCGKEHRFHTDVIVGSGVLGEVVTAVQQRQAKCIFLIADKNTYEAAGKAVNERLAESGIAVEQYIFQCERPEPDERAIGLAIMHYPPNCDVVLGVGSGVINDIAKLVAAIAKKPYIVLATAPSMDGYASPSSSVTRDGLKISFPSRCPDVIIGDLDVLCQAPTNMLLAGLGDMLAKYVSICEWRIARIVVGEYYCDRVARLMREALKHCVDNVDGLLRRDPAAVSAVFEGLVISGAAMQYAGLTRPASGVEHYFSHIWDMRGLEFGTPIALHGLQCAVGTIKAVKLYEALISVNPNRQQALAYVNSFDPVAWQHTLRDFLGRGANGMIALEEKEGKYDRRRHAERLDRILSRWDDIAGIVREELPAFQALERLYDHLGLPKNPEDIGLDNAILPLTFQATRDIRDKYVLSRMFWDLGLTEQSCWL